MPPLLPQIIEKACICMYIYMVVVVHTSFLLCRWVWRQVDVFSTDAEATSCWTWAHCYFLLLPWPVTSGSLSSTLHSIPPAHSRTNAWRLYLNVCTIMHHCQCTIIIHDIVNTRICWKTGVQLLCSMLRVVHALFIWYFTVHELRT